ncbi:MAG TPA: NF038122 family metalloprotease [Phenylobacterium sp.]|jgi:Ca2+-binding RTX toxin-like protein|uniref:NF038122 family metalloprotease n=1 Tax=Phenylobacterium sp. TaxID=1871053 RepID=UPI002B960752|nr:NF038122 family metalloprotease [Phenylobacterium sp.]HXA38101.1 NF038122 family metalloprotease [Phenylobacterium sp.]
MTLATEAVTLAGSGLVFINDYSAAVTPAYRDAIIAAENTLQSSFTNQLTVSVSFDYQALGQNVVAQNNFDETDVSYSAFVAALRAHATTPNDLLAVNGLPASDPSNGAGFAIPTAEAVMLGLAKQTNAVDDQVTLNSSLNLTFNGDATGAVLHEISEGVFGRVASLGVAETRWNPLDLFRFTAAGQRDYTGGSDGVTTYFGLDPSHVSSLAYHSSVSATGKFDGSDLGDWASTLGDAFGPGSVGVPATLSTTDLQVLDVLGWNPSSSSTFTPAPDDFANSLTDTTHPFGHIAVGGTAAGALQIAGDRDWFTVQFQAGVTYTISETGQAGGGGTLGDPYLRLHDASGALVASNDDITLGSNPDSRIVFTATTSGTYYVEAGAFTDGYAGSYTVGVTQGGSQPTAGQVLNPGPGDNTLVGGAGDDTITGGSGSNYLRGGPGDDIINGGSGFNDMNGNQGNDTLHGGTGSNWVVGGQGDDSLVGGGGYQDLVLGNLGNDTLHAGSQANVLRGGQGDDSIVGGAGNDFISGDLGNDTEVGGGGADIFHGSQNIGVDQVMDFNYAQGDRVELDPGTTYVVNQIGANTVIDMGNGSEMILVGVQLSSLPSGWIFEGTLSHL